MANNTSKNIRKSINLLPAFFRTDKNNKFLSSTIDQLIKVPVLERIDGFVGSKLSSNYNPLTDNYITESLPLREKYQLEPAVVLKNIDQSIKAAYGFDDLVNQVSYYGGNVDNLDRLFRPKFNSYDPRIDWDKFINYRNYYWLPNGPDAISVAGLQRNTISTYTVTDSDDKNFFVFTPDGLTPDPLLTFYRGITYVFNVDSTHELYIKTEPVDGTESQYTRGVIGNGTKKGQIIITIDDQTPSVLFYAAGNNQLAGGRVLVKSILENSAIDIEKEILGKSNFTSGNGVEFINGMKVRFLGNVVPSAYINNEYIVEGVGSKIQLIDFTTLTTPLNPDAVSNTNFDGTPFDDFPFDNVKNIPETPEYITINRSSKDLNPWSRYNRWVHTDVISAAASANGTSAMFSENFRAVRPIIEFKPNIQLWNFGSKSIATIDYIDTITTDAFSVIEGTAGYSIENTLLENGNLIIFNADPDPMVQGKIFQADVSIFKGRPKVRLTEVQTPIKGDSVVINSGTLHQGSSWWFNGKIWIKGQQRTSINQAPLFDLFDIDGYSYSDLTYYNSNFCGNKLFGYAVGSGTVDSVLGFPLQYTSASISTVGTYLFTNYLNTESISLEGTTLTIPTANAYLRINANMPEYVNAWTTGELYNIPVEQFQVITTVQSRIEITVYNNPATIADLKISVFVNNIKKVLNTDYLLVPDGKRLYVKFKNPLAGTTTPVRVLFKCYSATSSNVTGDYETPINLTNNPLNYSISNFTLTELSDHVRSMTDADPGYTGNNLKSLPNITKYGSRLINSQNPLTFAQCFITNAEHNLINATRQVADDYYQFKLNLTNFISKIPGNLSASETLDQALIELNSNKNSSFPYARSDMLGYGNNCITNSYTVTDSRNTDYAITSIFSISTLSDRAISVYHTSNGITLLLVYGQDYDFALYDPTVHIVKKLGVGDVLTIKDYTTTVRSYIPPTPTKLGLFPKYQPQIYIDNSYAEGPQKVIQGHDGSLTVAFSKYDQPDDYRDLVLLEYETRIYNNLKVSYNPALVDIHKLLPSAFRTTEYTYNEVYNIVRGDFLKWAGVYGIDFATNSAYDINNHKTYNFKSAKDYTRDTALPGNWRAIYKLYFDTDRPNTHPWEMLGITVKPTWWDAQYGAAPYTAGNLNLWQDLEAGIIRYPSGIVTDPTYTRPGLSQFIPVDDSGNIIDVRNWAGIAKNDSIMNTDQDWAFGDHGPAETAWRRSSLWPFAVQIILTLTKPADYAAMLFDTSRVVKDITGQYKYGVARSFLNPKDVLLYTETDTNGNTVLASGYSVWVIEQGLQRSTTYLTTLKNDLTNLDLNLFYKAGGFLSKDKLEITIDSISPTTTNPGVALPNEDYTLHFNVSAPVKSAAISGIIIEKKNGQFAVKGYDNQYPYFVVNQPVHVSTDRAVTVGGRSEIFLSWKINSFYQAGQVVFYSNVYYRVVTSHNSGAIFTSKYYKAIAQLPTVGGASVLVASQYETTETTVPYGTRYNTLQEVYDLLMGYGHWLSAQGFIFDEYNKDLNQVLDWKFTGKEFLYWSTQNWADGAVITLSPFADTIKYRFNNAVVDNVLNSFYEYSLIKANGQPFPTRNFSLSREDGVCSIKTKNTTDGIFFARLNLVQKEHALIMNNKSMFSDIVYDIQTGYRQSRVKLTGFRTAEWNGEFLSPGFIYDNAQINDWSPYTDYQVVEIVKYVGNYYSANINIVGTTAFDFNNWNLLGTKPVAKLLPNFDYKISQFEDFYSLDTDNFDIAQQRMAQHLIGYTPREYLDNIFANPIAQYKFYQGYIREKGTKNSIDKLAKASSHTLNGSIEYKEEWAFRIGNYGNFVSYNELEFPLREADFRENSQIIKFVNTAPIESNDTVSYITPADLTMVGDTYTPALAFATASSTYTDNNLIMPVAGYVRTDDVTATAYNKNSLLDIANNGSIQEGNTIWLGFRDDGQWDVYRYTAQRPKIVNSTVTVPAAELTFTTDLFHNLLIGDIVSVYGLDNGTDGVYIITDIPSLTSFTVATTLASAGNSEVTALLFKFVSVRIDQFDNLTDLQKSVLFKNDELIWVDSNNSGKWTVYKKSNTYSTSTELAAQLTQTNQQFGFQIATQNNADIVAIASPRFYSATAGYGRVYVYEYINGVMSILFNYGINDTTAPTTVSTSTQTNFGTSLVYDTESDSIFAGAAGVDLIKISGINRTTNIELRRGGAILRKPTAGAGEYGSAIFVSKTATTNKLLLVGAPATNTSSGAVYAYNLSISTSTITYLSTATITPSTNLGDRVGESITGSADGKIIAISAPGTNGIGAVYIYTTSTSGSTNFVQSQLITAPSVCKLGDRFGSTVLMSNDASYMFVASVTANDSRSGLGKVFVYKKNASTQYVLNQTIDNPMIDINLNFGYKLAIDELATLLTVTGLGDNKVVNVTLDGNTTTMDNNTCLIGDIAKGSGAVYVFSRYNDKFIYAEELFDSNVLDVDLTSNKPLEGSQYGTSVAVNNGTVMIGAPGKVADSGSVYVFSKISNINSWNVHREQDDLIDLSKINRAVTIDSLNQKTLDYLDIIDPAKGHIAGLADQEIRYKTAFDPAIYSIGVQGVVVDTNASWIEPHLGELWWDLSTVKYTWYEQSDLKYRKNSWGKLFPGASIDVYEWVSSEYLPSQWSSLADTADGISKGISGQPKYPDNSVISVKQYYNATSGGTTNVYFYWVKNKVTLPDVEFRKISANEVARLIYNPASYGLKYISILDADSISITNVTPTLSQNNIYLNISKDEIVNSVNQHTEWMLLADGDSNSMPNSLLEKKLIDSLLGRDSLGNPVPDPNLSDRVKYGVSIRPRQGLFKDRIAALRNAIDYTNIVLAQTITTDIINFKNLNSKDPIPDIELGQYDQQIDTDQLLNEIVTTHLKQAKLSCEIINGRIANVTVNDPGYGYLVAPTVEILNDTTGAIISTTINAEGAVISASVIETGSGYLEIPELVVRPYTVIITADSTNANRWTEYQWQYGRWNKTRTQRYDTTLLWDYIDWKSSNYDPVKPLAATVAQVYLLDTLSVMTGDYVKVKNQGNGRYIVLSKVDKNGTFDDAYDLVYSEKGTIQFKERLWNTTNSTYNFDYLNTYDQTLYDQGVEIELERILLAIKEDIFTGPLRVYWNKFFFKAVRYAMSEQKFLDWAFKTSFINVANMAGSLDQRSIFKFQNSSYYESYLNEVKPYHTKIRNFQVEYDVVEPTHSYTTDFDLPANYDSVTNKFMPIELNNPLLNSYPRKGWADNYKFSIGKIVISDGGGPYTTVPTVQIIPAAGDVVTTATAVAYISIGKVYAVEITNPGNGYTRTPTVVFTGGGSSTVIQARAYAQLSNDKVRVNKVGVKFDRVTGNREIDSKQFTDQFFCPGGENEFLLSWAAEYKKSEINITLDGISVFAFDYSIINYTELTNGYHKLYSKLVLTNVPIRGQILKITYNKNINLYHATDRVQDYYTPADGMPGADSAQVMRGIDYPGIQYQTLPFNYTANWDMLPFAEAPWDDDGNGDDTLDTILDGGQFTGTTLVNALGVNPEDIIVDGDTFISPNVSHGPEELVPGEVVDSLAISVYTRVASGSPRISKNTFTINSTATSTTSPLDILPPNTSSLMVSFNRGILDYGKDYTVDFNNKTITISTQTTTGIVSVTIVGVGGIGYLSQNAVTSTKSSFTVPIGAALTSIGSLYVTLNGNTITTDQYTLGNKGVTVSNLTGTNTVQLWAFSAEYKGFSEVKEQFFTTYPFLTAYTLTQYPGTLGPINAQAIVELNKLRLTPPNTTYYSAAAGQVSFDIDPNNQYPTGVFSLDQLQVFVNGIQSRPGVDFILDQPNDRVEFNINFLKSGDAVAITNTVYGQYYFENGQIILNTRQLTIPTNGTLKVITYTNHNSSMIRTEVFASNASRRFTMSRAIINDNYVWVTIGGTPLINGVDFYIEDDNKTIIIRGTYVIDLPDAPVTIMSMIDALEDAVIGYRVFKDLLNRTTFRRLSEIDSTRLIEPLYSTSTTIVVNSGAGLPKPNTKKGIPGVVVIAGERIEYMAVTDNVLSRLRRATLGTGPKSVYPIGTVVTDQGQRQALPFREVTNVVTTASTSTLETSYVIENMSVTTGGKITFAESTGSTHQVKVYHGGILLRKAGMYVHDSSVVYDGVSSNILGTVPTIAELPITTLTGNAYIVSATNQVWVYTNSNKLDAVNGYTYQGLNYLPPEFTITTSTANTNTVLTLNLPASRLNKGTIITLVQQTTADWYADNNTSLINDTGAVATFLRDKQTSLPDKYHYGQL